MSDQLFYVTASSTTSPAGGVYAYELTPQGELLQRSFAALPKAGYLCWSPNRQFLYATSADAAGHEGAAALRVAPDGQLELINQQSSMGKSTCHCEISADGRKLYTANYFSATIAEFEVDPEAGKILQLNNLTMHSGSGPNPERQECAHPHFCRFAPDGRIVVCDLGSDRLYAYLWSAAEGLTIANAVITQVQPAGSGPRHLVFSADGRLAYLINEMGNTVQSYTYSDGKFELLHTVSTLPPHCTATTKASAIRLDATGKFLLVGNRGYDSVATIAVDNQGHLELADLVMADGQSPRDVNFLPGNRMCASCNEFSDNVTFFDFNPETGKLTRNPLELHLPCPRCLIF